MESSRRETVRISGSENKLIIFFYSSALHKMGDGLDSREIVAARKAEELHEQL